MNVQPSTARVEAPRTTKPATGTGKPKEAPKAPERDAREIQAEAAKKAENDPTQRALKKVQSVDTVA